MTRTITIDPDQYKRLCEYSQRSGRTVYEIVLEALNEWIDSVMKAREGEAAQT